MKVKVCKLLAFIFIIIFALSAANAVHAVGVITSPISVGNEPEGLAYDPAKGEIFVANGFSSSVSVISDSNNSVVATINLATSPGPIVYDSGKGEIFAANYESSGVVYVISDTNNSVVATVPVGANPEAIVYDSGKSEIFVSNFINDTVSVISDSNNTVVATIPVGYNPSGLAYDHCTGEIYVTDLVLTNKTTEVPNSVSIISDSNNTVVANVYVGSGGGGLVYDSGTGEIFAASSDSASVSVISETNNTVVATVPVESNSFYEAYDSGKDEIFVGGGANSNLVSVTSDSNDSVVSEVTVGSPSGLTYDSAKGEMFISDWSAGTVSVISDSSILPPLSTPTSSPSPTPIESPPPNSSQTEVATTITALTVEPNPDVLNQTVSIGNFTISNGNGSGWSTLTISALIQPSPPSSTDVFRDLTLNVLEPDGGTEMSGPYTSSSDGSVSFTWSGVLEVGNVTLTLSFHGARVDNNSVYYQPSSSSIIVSVQAPATPTPTSASTPALTSSATTVPATTDKGSIVDLAISGNITSSQMSNVTIATNQSAASTTVSFTVTGERGTTGFSNITIPISVVAYGTPTIYIDGQPAQSQGYTQDANNYYVWYTTSFSTHQISIVFTTASSNPSASPNQTWPSLVQSVMFGVASAIAIAIIAAFALECKKSIRTTFDFKQKTKKMRKL